MHSQIFSIFRIGLAAFRVGIVVCLAAIAALRVVLLAFLVVLGASVANAQDACLALKSFVNVHNPKTNVTRQFDPTKSKFRYGSEFWVEFNGSLPGTFNIVSHRVTKDGTLIHQFPSLYQETGTAKIAFPCGNPFGCNGDEERFIFVDDDPAGPRGQEIDEHLVIDYYPCRTGDPQEDHYIQPIVHALDKCTGAPVAHMPREILLAGIAQSILTTKMDVELCEPERDLEGRVRLRANFPMKAVR